MNCNEALTDLPELVTGGLPAERAWHLEAHLTACDRCRRERDALRQVSLLLRRTATPEVDVDVATVYREAARRERLHSRRWRRAAFATAVAAAAVLLLAVGLNLEVRIEHHQAVVRWGAPPPQETLHLTVAPAPPPRDDENEQRVRVLQKLVQALAADVRELELRQQQDADRSRALADRRRRAAALRDAGALYDDRFTPTQGDEP